MAAVAIDEGADPHGSAPLAFGPSAMPQLLEGQALVAAAGAHPADGFAAAITAQGVQTFIANVTSRLAVLNAGGHAFPVTIDDGGYGRSYVASPHSAYVAYARREMALMGLKRGRAAASTAIAAADALLRAARVNRIVHLDNWLLSTNLHGGWRGEGLAAMRQMLTARFPDHWLAIRSLDDWGSPALLATARDDGWLLLPARQIWVVDDVERQWRCTRDAAYDQKLLDRSGLRITMDAALTPELATQIAGLYRQLYLGKYSPLNPDFTAPFIDLLQQTGWMRYHLAHDRHGALVAVAGVLARGDVMTVPVLGYDLARPQDEGLYRIACHLCSMDAASRGLRLHQSAGAAEFKRRRGARPQIEYMAVYARHLPAYRRAPLYALRTALERWVVPMMQSNQW